TTAASQSRQPPSSSSSMFIIEAEDPPPQSMAMIVRNQPAVLAGSILPLDPKGLYDDPDVHHKAYKTDAESSQQLAAQLTKQYIERTRQHPENLDTWLQLARLQEKITKLQRGIAGGLSTWSKIV